MRLIGKECVNSFDELLSKDSSFRIHLCNLQRFSVEIFKIKFSSPTGILTNFKSRNIHTVRYGTETASFIAPRIWSSISKDYNECNSVFRK